MNLTKAEKSNDHMRSENKSLFLAMLFPGGVRAVVLKIIKP